MTAIREMLRYAWLAEAAYTLISNPIRAPQLLEELQDGERGGEFSSSQAQRLLAVPSPTAEAPLGCTFLHQIDLSAVGQSGFSATLIQDTVSGRFILAVRGTEFPRDIAQDVVDADVFGIAAGGGVAGPQFADLLIYVRQLSTAGGQPVVFTDDEVRHLARLRRTDTYYDFGLRIDVPRTIEELRAQFGGIFGVGEPGAVALLGDASFVAVGHSLGGHLASLAGAYFGSRVTEVVTFNAPGFIAGRFAGCSGFLSGQCLRPRM